MKLLNAQKTSFIMGLIIVSLGACNSRKSDAPKGIQTGSKNISGSQQQDIFTAQIQEQKTLLEKANTDIATAEKKSTDRQKEIDKLNAQLKNNPGLTATEKANMQKSLEAATTEKATLDQQIVALKAQTVTLQKQLEEARVRITQLEKELAAIKAGQSVPAAKATSPAADGSSEYVPLTVDDIGVTYEVDTSGTSTAASTPAVVNCSALEEYACYNASASCIWLAEVPGLYYAECKVKSKY